MLFGGTSIYAQSQCFSVGRAFSAVPDVALVPAVKAKYIPGAAWDTLSS
ncbi:hypothetical protein GCM10028868_00330 [Virgibacillus kimchii]